MKTRSKRAREEVPTFECAVCLSDHPEADGTYCFDCTHPLCETCSLELKQRNNHRCPTCRAPRAGLDDDQANEGAYIASMEEQHAASTFLQAQQLRAELRSSNLADANGTAALASLMMNRLHAVSPAMFREILASAVDTPAAENH